MENLINEAEQSEASFQVLRSLRLLDGDDPQPPPVGDARDRPPVLYSTSSTHCADLPRGHLLYPASRDAPPFPFRHRSAEPRHAARGRLLFEHDEHVREMGVL